MLFIGFSVGGSLIILDYSLNICTYETESQRVEFGCFSRVRAPRVRPKNRLRQHWSIRKGGDGNSPSRWRIWHYPGRPYSYERRRPFCQWAGRISTERRVWFFANHWWYWCQPIRCHQRRNALHIWKFKPSSNYRSANLAAWIWAENGHGRR